MKRTFDIPPLHSFQHANLRDIINFTLFSQLVKPTWEQMHIYWNQYQWNVPL
jgi:hypothetical protein